MDDIRESIAELQHYRDTLFPKAPLNPPTLDE
jgi:oligoribonuclease (3'-5' exoribonuclease)